MNARTSLAGIVLICAALLSGCAGVINEGGDTKCKDFQSFEQDKQDAAVSKMLKDQSGNDPSNLEISATRTAVILYCKTLGNDNSKIKDAPHM